MGSDKRFSTIFDIQFSESEAFYFTLQTFLKSGIGEMNHSLKNLVRDEPDILSASIEGSIVLLDYLVTYYQLSQLILEKFQDNHYFAQESKIEQIAEGRPVRLTKQHFSQIRNKIYSLEISQ